MTVEFPKFKVKNTKTGQEIEVYAPDKEGLLNLICTDQDWVTPEQRKYPGWWDIKYIEIKECEIEQEKKVDPETNRPVE
jgi:hypothetical protein